MPLSNGSFGRELAYWSSGVRFTIPCSLRKTSIACPACLSGASNSIAISLLVSAPPRSTRIATPFSDQAALIAVMIFSMLVPNPPWSPSKVWAVPVGMRLYKNRQGLTKGKKGQAKGKDKKGKKRPPDPNHRTRPELVPDRPHQRIASARPQHRDPRILILDDSTSAIDSATEDDIQKAIDLEPVGHLEHAVVEDCVSRDPEHTVLLILP